MFATLAGTPSQPRQEDNFTIEADRKWFALGGAEFDVRDLSEVQLWVNDAPVPAGRLKLSPHLISAADVLADGRNRIALSVYDNAGRPLYFNAVLWAGSGRLRIEMVAADGAGFLAETTVTATLRDDPGVRARVVTANGTAEFRNLPEQTILVNARSGDRYAGQISVTGSQRQARVTVAGR